MTALADTLEQVTPDQIKHFDHDAQHLVMDYHLAGWQSHMTSKGHVFLKAPDGSETASVSRESLRGRSGRNAAAPLKRWRRRQAEEWEAERKRKAAGSTFGIKDIDEVREEEIPSLDNRMPPRVAAALKDHPAIMAYIRENADRFDGPKAMQESLYIGIDYDGPKPPWQMWTMVDTEAGVLVAHGPGYTREKAMAMLREQGKLPKATHEEVMAAATGTVCPECDYDAGTRSNLMLHVRKHTGFVCPECGEHTGYSARVYAAHRSSEHGVTPAHAEKQLARARRANPCSYCEEGFTTPQGLANHERLRHGRDVRGRVLSMFKAADRPLSNEDLQTALGMTLSGAKSTLLRLRKSGDLVRIARNRYTLADTRDGDDVLGTSPDVPRVVVPERDSESRDVAQDVMMTSPDVPQVWVGEPADMLARVRAIVAPELETENAQLRARNETLVHENEKLTKQLDDANALLSMLNEYAAQRGGGAG